MKKAFIVLLVLGSAATQSFGQDKAPKNNAPFYLRIGGTYAFSHAGQTAVGGAYINGSYSSDASYSGGQTSTFSETYDLKKASFGNGITAVVACGAMLHKHIGVELAVSIGITAKKYTYSYVDNETGSSPTYTYKFTQQTTMYQRTPILLMPSVVLQSGGEKLNVYSRMGLALPVAGKFIMERRITENHSNNPSTIGADDAWEYKTKFAVGLQGALGVQLALGDRAAFYIEANGVSMNAYAKSGSMTKFTVNGIDRQSELDRSEKEITFDLSDTKSSSQSANEPDRAPTFSIPYSNIGIGVGLIFKL